MCPSCRDRTNLMYSGQYCFTRSSILVTTISYRIKSLYCCLWGSYLCLVVTIRETSRTLPNLLITGQHYFNGSSISCRDNIFHGSSGRIQETLRRHQFLYGMMRNCGNVTGPYVLYSTEGIQNNRLHVTAPSLYFNICNVLWGLSLFRVL